MEHNGVVGDGFQMVALPAAIASDKFLQNLQWMFSEEFAAQVPAVDSYREVEGR